MQVEAGEAAMERRFDAAFRAEFADLLAWRRDVRRFQAGSVPEATLDALLRLAALAPSVGNCQPARFVRVDDENSTRRGARQFRGPPTPKRSPTIAASGRSSMRR